MPRCKRVIRSGDVIEQEVYNVSDRSPNPRRAEPKPVIKTPEEREMFNIRQSLKRFIRVVNTNFNCKSLYATLTFDDAHLPPDYAAAKRIRDNYIRRLQYAYPKLIAVIVMGRGKFTKRLHMHMLIAGVDEQTVRKKWKQGSIVRIENLREHNFYGDVDHGQDYTGLATYLFKHWTPEQGGKRWKPTKTVQQPDRRRPTLPKRHYSLDKPPLTPKGFMLVSAHASGRYEGEFLYFKYVRIPSPYPRC